VDSDPREKLTSKIKQLINLEGNRRSSDVKKLKLEDLMMECCPQKNVYVKKSNNVQNLRILGEGEHCGPRLVEGSR
jgi:hypothetical protein